jgi:hypothetical protein
MIRSSQLEAIQPFGKGGRGSSGAPRSSDSSIRLPRIRASNSTVVIRWSLSRPANSAAMFRNERSQLTVGSAVSAVRRSTRRLGEAEGQHDQVIHTVRQPAGPPRKANSFMIPTTLRFEVVARRRSDISTTSCSMNVRLMACASSTVATAARNRSRTVAAGASGNSTGSRVDSLTNDATCGFQNSAVAYQLPNNVVGCSTGTVVGVPTRSRNFLVP